MLILPEIDHGIRPKNVCELVVESEFAREGSTCFERRRLEGDVTVNRTALGLNHGTVPVCGRPANQRAIPIKELAR